MATRSGGGTSTALIGKLQEARASLEAHLGCPVSCAVTDHGLALYAYPPPPKKGRFGKPSKVIEVPSEWNGFRVEAKDPGGGRQ